MSNTIQCPAVTEVESAGSSSASGGVASGPRQISAPATALEPELVAIADLLVVTLQECHAYALGWKIKAGIELLAQKQQLPADDWKAILESGRLGFCRRTLQTLLRIAANGAFRNSENLKCLPDSVAALYELATLRPWVIEQAIKTGAMHPAMTAFEAKQFVLQHNPPFKSNQPLQATPRLV